MSTVRELREELEELVGGARGRRKLVNQLLTELARHGDMDIRELWRRIGYDGKQPPTRARAKFDRDAAIEALGVVFYSDDRFRAELGKLSSNRAATKAEILAIYNTMYGRQKKASAKVTREGLLQDIADERNLLVRSKKTAAFLSGT